MDAMQISVWILSSRQELTEKETARKEACREEEAGFGFAG
jgi:hypothetical protein